MSTKKQLHFVLESELEYFGGTEVPRQHFEGVSEDNGLTSPRSNNAPVSRRRFSKRKGKKIGKYIWSKAENTLKLIVDSKK